MPIIEELGPVIETVSVPDNHDINQRVLKILRMGVQRVTTGPVPDWYVPAEEPEGVYVLLQTVVSPRAVSITSSIPPLSDPNVPRTSITVVYPRMVFAVGAERFPRECLLLEPEETIVAIL